MSGRARGLVCALLAAVLFGVSTPFTRPVLARVDPAASAGYLYLGQAIVLLLLLLGRSRSAARRREAALGRAELPALVLGVVAGGLVAPGAFTAGLALVSAHRVSLPLGLETVFTLLIAIVFRRERLAPRAWAGIAFLLAAGVLVTLSGRSDASAGAAVEATTHAATPEVAPTTGTRTDETGTDEAAVSAATGGTAADGERSGRDGVVAVQPGTPGPAAAGTGTAGVITARREVGGGAGSRSGTAGGVATHSGLAGGAAAAGLAGSLLVVLACAGWAIDSNATAGIAGKDATAIALVKGIAAAAGYLGGCILAGRAISAAPRDLAALLVIGAFGYGLSLRFFILALRNLGAAMTTGVFASAPIVGFTASVAILGERPSPGGWLALGLSAAGIFIVSTARHDHEHVHPEERHEHPHVHDEHHDHEHLPGTEAVDGHTHPHRHERLEHAHPHEADVHHTHKH